LLRTRPKRPRNCRATEKRDELAPLHDRPTPNSGDGILATKPTILIGLNRHRSTANVSVGSKPEKLAASKYRPLFTQ
jgi:hypothetical protein